MVSKNLHDYFVLATKEISIANRDEVLGTSESRILQEAEADFAMDVYNHFKKKGFIKLRERPKTSIISKELILTAYVPIVTPLEMMHVLEYIERLENMIKKGKEAANE